MEHKKEEQILLDKSPQRFHRGHLNWNLKNIFRLTSAEGQESRNGEGTA